MDECMNRPIKKWKTEMEVAKTKIEEWRVPLLSGR